MEEDEAAQGLMDLNPDTEMTDADVDAAILLTSLKQDDINKLEAAALALLNLNRLKTPGLERQLKEEFKELSYDNVVENAIFLANYGLIPEVEAEPPRRSIRTLEKQTKLQQEEEARKQKELEVKSTDVTIGITNKFKDLKPEEISPYLRNLDVCKPRSASVFMTALFPTKVVLEWKDTLKRKCRDIYELSGVTAQCNYSIGKVSSNDVCYLCGFKFDESIEGLQATCEHILPIIQAIFFLDLYRPAEKGHTPEEMNILKKEYAWAHRCCNYVKGDNSFLVTKIKKSNLFPTWSFGTNTTSQVLNTLFKTEKYQGTKNIQEQIKNYVGSNSREIGFTGWLNDRMNFIRDEKMKPIVTFIENKGLGGTALLIGFGNCVDSTKLNKDFKELLSKYEKGEILTLSNLNKRKNPKALKTTKQNKFPKVGNKITMRKKIV